MKRPALFLTMTMAVAALSAQNATYNHDASKMNQMTVAEIGSGSLTPELYYTLLHSSYRKSAASKNKLGFRTLAGIAAYQQIDDATDLDSAMIKRAEIEALNVADRTGGALDVAWLAEKEKITSKMDDFKKNIDRILQFGGTPSQQSVWKEHYNVLSTAVKATQDAYMPNSQRKKQYLQIYADAARRNETLVRYLVRLSSSRKTTELLNSSYTRPSPNASAAAEALSRWRDAGWTASGKASNVIDNE
ncbi:MAG: DUF5045 domain-containing protein [Roseburia sp.]|nr:DUF5045 domain-containing protein [Roseburia sp.]MCM1419885.1 DUF5045 domain-containing protein [Bacteroides sp.]